MWRRDSQQYCADCPRPGILPGNQLVWQLFEAVDTQLITSFGGVIGLNYCAVDRVAQWLKIPMNELLHAKLKTIEHAYVDHLNAPNTETNVNAPKETAA